MRILIVLAAASLLGPAVSVTALDFNDDDYHEYILFDWDKTELDVLILPAAAPALARTAAITKSIDAWEVGIQALGAPWLTSALDIRPYTVGVDTIPTSALTGPEIVVASGEANPFVLFGIGASSDFLVCSFVDEPIFQGEIALPKPHRHPGSDWMVGIGRCDDSTENVCLVLNTNFAVRASAQNRMYDLSAHEFGHCLGIGHVGDALDFEAKEFPKTDIMSYQFDPAQVHCVSTLNVRAIEGTFAKVLGRPSSEWLDSGDYLAMKKADYAQVSCANP